MTTKRYRVVAYVTRALTVVAIVVAALLIYSLLLRTAPKVKTVDPADTVRRVTVFKAHKLPVRRQWHGYGTAAAMDTADVPARVTATVERIGDRVQAGLPVGKGQLLVQLDAHDFERQVEIAEHEIADIDAQIEQIKVARTRLTEQLALEVEDITLARRELGRLEKLREQGASNQGELDAARRAVIDAERTRLLTAETAQMLDPRWAALRAQHASSESRLKQARQDLERCSIASPIEGVLAAVDVEVGESITAGDRVARVVDLRRVEVALKLPSAAHSSIAVGNTISIAATNQSGLTWSAPVSRITPEDDVNSRTTSVYVEVDQTQAVADGNWIDYSRLLMPGAFVRGVATSDVVEQRWLVPRRSVGEGRVWVVAGGVVASRPAKVQFIVEGRRPATGMPDTQWAVLDGSLSEGELILANASISVLDGEPVVAVLPNGDEMRKAQADASTMEAVR